MKGKPPIIALVAGVILVAVWWISHWQDEGLGASYGGKTVSEWFFGDRTNFLSVGFRKDDTYAAFKAMGTNALPFLFAQLDRRESWLKSIYFKVYPKLPMLIQGRIPRPISQSDIQVIALLHLQTVGRIPAHWIKRFAEWVVAQKDDQLRHRGMGAVVMSEGSLENKPHVIGMLNRLVQDHHFLIRLDAALELIRRDEITTNAFPILRDCIADYQLVSRSSSIRGYRFGQPPQSTNRVAGSGILTGPPGFVQDQAGMLQKSALNALLLIEPSLDRTSREKLWLTFAELPIKTPPERSIDRMGFFPDDVEKIMGMRLKEGIRLLISLLSDPDSSRREQAAKALRWFGDLSSEAKTS